jgi:hypothetical protein
MTLAWRLTLSLALPFLAGGASLAAQTSSPTPIGTVAMPQRDPVTVRGCLDKRWLRILEHDSTDLSGVKRVRLKGSRAMLALVDDGRGQYVEITGDLDAAAADRLETRRKRQVGSKTTISIGASAEQSGGGAVPVGPEPTLVVEAIIRLAASCRAR